MTQPPPARRNFFVELFDILFIMLLCFLTLFLSMFMTGHASTEMTYVFDGKTFVLAIVGMALYLAFVLYHSERDLISMVRKVHEGHQ